MDSMIQESDCSFHLGEMFDSYEELEDKLEKFSKRSLVHYWRRDSRTVSGAHMKTARPISEKLKYYSVKYACIYGGQKFLPRGAGRRQSQSIRTNCPAHIMLRASKDGTKLEVTSVNNEHNHEISEELFRKLPQERKLCGEIKQEVQDLMQLHIDRKRLKEYVRLRTNKVLRSKDLFNIAAANKQKREITAERAYQLYQRIHDLEKLHGRDGGKRKLSESEEEISERLKKLKKDANSPWGQDGLSPDLDVSVGNDGENSYTTALTQEEVVDDIGATESQLLSHSNEGDIITANRNLVGELVMDDSDPSVIVESIVNADGSVFVDERDFNNYCHNHLQHDDNHSPGTQVLDIETIATSADVEKLGKTTNNEHHCQDPLSAAAVMCKSPTDEEHHEDKIWIVKPATNIDSDAPDNSQESEKTSKTLMSDGNPDITTEVFTDDSNHQLIFEQLAVLRAEKSKLYQETEMLKLKKDKLKLQISCYSNELKKQEMEKEKLRLEIKLLQAKVVDEANDVSHYIFVP
uniref:ZSWIM3 N-terminal domain-containing protein n=1 Tax=Bracon brevicornis TaxID=1563983 RepID=A0A6V7IYE1_9HYME